MLEVYPKVEEKFLNSEADKEVELLFSLIKEVRNYKVENKIAPNAKLDLFLNLKIEVSNDFLIYLNRFTFSNIELSKDVMNKSGDLFSLDYADLLISNEGNKEEVIAKLKKDIEIEKAEIARCEKMLTNENFLAKAPEVKIQQEKDKLALHKANLEGLLKKIEKIS